MTDRESFDELKSFVYGIGRGCGIKINPRHHTGEFLDQIASLARDVISAECRPTNDQLGEDCSTIYERLKDAVYSSANSTVIDDAIRRYIGARQHANSRGAVE